MPNAPWTSGPREVLKHALTLLEHDSDSNRRLAMIMIDNAVELMIKTYLSLPKRVTGLAIGRKKYQEISDSFPSLLDALEAHAASKLDGIDLGEIEWYHQVRNELYHQGHGLTVEKDKVEVYAQLARALFRSLFGGTIGVPEPEGTRLLGEFIGCWVDIERTLYRLAEVTYPDDRSGGEINVDPIAFFLARDKTIDTNTASEVDALRQIRNAVIHGRADHKTAITGTLMDRMSSLRQSLEERVREVIERTGQRNGEEIGEQGT
jgi:hypothetical protein